MWGVEFQLMFLRGYQRSGISHWAQQRNRDITFDQFGLQLNPSSFGHILGSMIPLKTTTTGPKFLLQCDQYLILSSLPYSAWFNIFLSMMIKDEKLTDSVIMSQPQCKRLFRLESYCLCPQVKWQQGVKRIQLRGSIQRETKNEQIWQLGTKLTGYKGRHKI